MFVRDFSASLLCSCETKLLNVRNSITVMFISFYNNPAHPGICDIWHFINKWKTLTLPHHLTNIADSGTLISPHFIEVPSQKSEGYVYVWWGYRFCLYDFAIAFWNCSNIVVFFFQFHC